MQSPSNPSEPQKPLNFHGGFQEWDLVKAESWKHLEAQCQRRWQWSHQGPPWPDPSLPLYSSCTGHSGQVLSVSSQPPGWGIACTMWKRSVKLKRRGNASFGRDFPLRVRFQIMFCNNLLTCDRVSGKWDNADANYEEKKNHWCLEKMSWTMLNLTRQNSKSVENSKRCFERKQQRGRANAS